VLMDNRKEASCVTVAGEAACGLVLRKIRAVRVYPAVSSERRVCRTRANLVSDI
jgi:hypothetical protein